MKQLHRQLSLIAVFSAAFALALSGGAGMWVLRVGEEEKIVGIALCCALLVFSMLIHFVLTRPMVAETRWQTGQEAVRAAAAMRRLPIRAALLSWYLWVGMDIAGSFFYYVYFGNWNVSDRQFVVSVLLFACVLSGGGVAFLLQFYAYKMVTMPLHRAAAHAAVAHGYDGELHDVPAYGLRNKLVVSSLALLAGALLFSVLFGYTRIAEGMQARLAQRADGVMQRLAPEIERLLQGGEQALLAERLRNTQLGAGGQLFLVDRDGNDVLRMNERLLPLARLIGDTEPDWRAQYVVHRFPIRKDGYSVVAVFPWSLDSGDLAVAGKSFGWLFLFVAVVTIAVATFSAREMVTQVKEIVYRAERISRGDLSEPLEILSEDEAGEFSADLEDVRRMLRSILNDIDSASRQVEALSNKVLLAAQTVNSASSEQTTRVSAGLHAIERMASGFERISKGSVDLSARAFEGGSSIRELDTTVRAVDASTDHMVERVVSIRDGIEKMHRVSDLIFANLGDLSRSMDVTVRNIRKFSDSIRRNEERVGTARAVSTRVFDASREGLQHTGQTFKSIHAIEKSVEGIGGILDDLIQRLNDVGKLIGVIDEVADDTKLLSLNAAIIAAQAGARGRSFSVLAEKIKLLADSTNSATGQIIDMIDEVGEGSHQLAFGMERVRESVKNTRLAAKTAGERLESIIGAARAGFDGMALIASTSGKHVEKGQTVERSVVGLANAIDQIHSNVRSQRNRAVEVGSAMERVESGVRTLKTAARAQAEGGRVLSGSIEQVVTMVSHLNKILLEQQSEVLRIQEAMQAIEAGAVANQNVAKNLQGEVEILRAEAETFHQFVERFKLA